MGKVIAYCMTREAKCYKPMLSLKRTSEKGEGDIHTGISASLSINIIQCKFSVLDAVGLVAGGVSSL